MGIMASLKKGRIYGIIDKIAKGKNRSETFRFLSLPQSVGQMKELPEAVLDSPYKTAALTVAALCVCTYDLQTGMEMLDYLKGPQPLSEYEKSFLKDNFDAGGFAPFSYCDGAAPENDYTPTLPYTVTVMSDNYSYEQEGYVSLFVRSSGAEEMRPIVLRKKESKWFLWEQRILAGIRLPVSKDPWR